MELKLEDYARRIDRFYYEIMREYADGAPTTKDLEIFIRPDSGYLVVWHFCLQNDETKLVLIVSILFVVLIVMFQKKS